MVLKEGMIAPDFKLPNQDGKEVKLSTLRGNTVLIYFYPKDDTPGCTTEACSMRDSIAEFARAGRSDLVAEEEAELAILEEYLPRQLDREEIVKVVREIIDEVGATGPKQLGLVMKPAMARLRNQADGKLVSEVARSLLAG